MFGRGFVAVVAAALASCAPPAPSSTGLPHEALVMAAANYIAEQNQRVAVHEDVFNRSNGRSIQITPYPQIPYADGAALIRENPDCCVVGADWSDTPEPSCARGPFEVVGVQYRARYLDGAGVQQEQVIRRRVAVNHRGNVCIED